MRRWADLTWWGSSSGSRANAQECAGGLVMGETSADREVRSDEARVLLLHSDHELVPGAIRAAVSGRDWIVHEHRGSVTDLPEASRKLKPVVIVVVVHGSGKALRLCRTWRPLVRLTPTVFMSRREDAAAAEVFEVVREGAAGWLTLDMDPVRIPMRWRGFCMASPPFRDTWSLG